MQQPKPVCRVNTALSPVLHEADELITLEIIKQEANRQL